MALIPAAGNRDRDIAESVSPALILGTDQTHEQDVEFPNNQLVQLAVRALSPAINDPVTAIMAIEQLRAGLCYIAEQGAPSTVVLDANRVPRLPCRFFRQCFWPWPCFILLCYNATERQKKIAWMHPLRAGLVMIDRGGHGAQSALPEEADRQRVTERFRPLHSHTN